jgi:aminopeptidase
MSDPRVEKLAQVLVNYSLEVQPGQKIVLSGHHETRPLMVAMYREVIRAGGHPYVRWQDSDMQEILLKEGNDEQLSYVPEPVMTMAETSDAYAAILGTDNTRALSGVDPEHQQLASRAQTELNKLLTEREAKGEWTFVVAMYPTPANAQEADMSLSEYEDFVYNACYLDKEDPVAEWRGVSERQASLVDWLEGKERVKVQGPNVDLTLSIAGRGFINSAGRKNMPCGEIFTSPVEESAEGWIRFSYPAIVRGREVEGVELHFKEGKVVEARADKNEDFLLSVLDTDKGARYLGEFAIGTNRGIQQFTKEILFDEKIGGTIHLALGRGFPKVGGKNESVIHWDMICDMREGGKIWVDDELFYNSGEFTVA